MKTFFLAIDFSKSADATTAKSAHPAVLSDRFLIRKAYQQSISLLSVESICRPTEKNKVSSMSKLYPVRNRRQKTDYAVWTFPLQAYTR